MRGKVRSIMNFTFERVKALMAGSRLSASAKGAITPKALLVERFLRDPPFLGGSDWPGGDKYILIRIPFRTDQLRYVRDYFLESQDLDFGIR